LAAGIDRNGHRRCHNYNSCHRLESYDVSNDRPSPIVNPVISNVLFGARRRRRRGGDAPTPASQATLRTRVLWESVARSRCPAPPRASCRYRIDCYVGRRAARRALAETASPPRQKATSATESIFSVVSPCVVVRRG
jgi:hypothetical protein